VEEVWDKVVWKRVLIRMLLYIVCHLTTLLEYILSVGHFQTPVIAFTICETGGLNHEGHCTLKLNISEH
jgi:hypothetical protein